MGRLNAPGVERITVERGGIAQQNAVLTFRQAGWDFQQELALDAFAAFMLKYPDHPYVENAMYWRGECYFAQGEYVRAVEQLEGVLARFPSGGKTPDALLKLGISQQKLGNPQKAKTYFDKLTREWPRSDAARRIPENHP